LGNSDTTEEAGASSEQGRLQQQRLDSVMALVRQYQWDEAHSRHVTALALSLFDQLRPLHGLGDDARELLFHAGYMHDVGYVISAKSHHRHSYDIISGASLPGFSPWEVRVMAAIARYHRKRLPRPGDPEMAGLSREQKHLVRMLAAILRVADGSDRTHLSLVRRLRVTVDDDGVTVGLVAPPTAEMELYFAQEKADLLAVELGKKVRVQLEPAPGSSGEAG